MDRLLADAFADLDWMSSLLHDEGWEAVTATPMVDMRELNDAYMVVLCLPGINRFNVDVFLDGRLLTVASHGFPRERVRGQTFIFEKRLLLPGPVRHGRFAETVITNGSLRVLLPKGSEDGSRGKKTRLL
jgi:HSP20 family molecular chaperone IbpA